MQELITEIEDPIEAPAIGESQNQEPEPAQDDGPVDQEPVTDVIEFAVEDAPAVEESPEPDTDIGQMDPADETPVDPVPEPPVIDDIPPPPPPPPPTPVPNTLVSYGPFGFVAGTDGMDVILAYGFRTLAFGGGGDDTMIAFGGTAYFRGGDGNDVLIGGSMGDTLFGDDGNDQLLIGAGDFAVGGDGADQFIFSTTDKGNVIVSDFDAAEGDMLVFAKAQGVTCDLIENVNNTEIAFSDGLTVQLYGVTIDEVYDNPDLFGL